MFQSVDRKPARELANLLFNTCILDDLGPIVKQWREHYRSSSTFEIDTFEQHVFIYLAANVVVGLTNEHSRRPAIVHVISHLKPLIENELNRRWMLSENEVADLIEAAGSHLARLLFTDPNVEVGLAFDWAKEWLSQNGIEESNPITLFKFSFSWKNRYLFFAKLLSELPDDQFIDSA